MPERRTTYRDRRGKFTSKERAYALYYSRQGRTVKRVVAKKPVRKRVKKVVRKAVKKVVKKAIRKKVVKRAVVRKPVKKVVRKVVKKAAPQKRVRKAVKPKGKITYKYYNRFGRQVRTIGDASEIRFYRGGRRFGEPFPAMEARIVRPLGIAVRPVVRGTEEEYGYEHVFTGQWNPKKTTLRDMLTNALGRRLARTEMDVGNIIVTMGSRQLGLTVMSEVTVRTSWSDRRTRKAVYSALIYKMLQNIRAAGGNTSSDKMKTPGEIGSSSKGYPLPPYYTVNVWARDKADQEPEVVF